MRFRTAAFFFLIALICSWNGAKAQASDGLPAKIQRNWAQPDCGDYDEAMVLSKYFALKTTQKDMTLLPARLLHKRKDYWVVSIGDESRPVQLHNDGILAIGTYADDTPRRAKDWDAMKLDQTDEYTGCDTAPKIVPHALRRLMRYIDRISEQCTLSITNECAGVLFKLADEDNDKKLSLPEIRRMTDQALLLSALADKQTLTDQQATDILKKSRKDIDEIAAQMMAECDKNKSKSVDYNELVNNFTAPDVPVVKDMLKKIGALIPSFRLAALALK